jgi:hypothetical protein
VEDQWFNAHPTIAASHNAALPYAHMINHKAQLFCSTDLAQKSAKVKQQIPRWSVAA